MAQIDLRKADVYLKDGYTAAGTINQPGGYPSTTTTIAISGITMPIVNGSTFQIGGTGTVYTISSVVGGSTPTSLTFTPGLSTRAGWGDCPRHHQRLAREQRRRLHVRYHDGSGRL